MRHSLAPDAGPADLVASYIQDWYKLLPEYLVYKDEYEMLPKSCPGQCSQNDPRVQDQAVLKTVRNMAKRTPRMVAHGAALTQHRYSSS